jgi:general L-amino acid transport system substrate-binding protein
MVGWNRCWLLGLVLILSSCGQPPAPQTHSTVNPNSRLAIVKARGKLLCGIEGNVAGFSYLDKDGRYSGLDVDYCRAIAAGVLGDPNAVEYRPLDASERFAALTSGDIDVLSRNTTWTASRDAPGGNAMEFAPTTFYDGQGVMVKANSGIKRLEDLRNQSVCLGSGTTTELNFADGMRALGVPYTEVKFKDPDPLYAAFFADRCVALTADRSALAARKSQLPDPQNFEILDLTLSKEPLGPAVRNGDSDWFDAVKWITFVPIQAEEFGITQQNLPDRLKSPNPDMRRFLGQEGDLGQQLGLPQDFAAKVIQAVGNYGEIYDRNVGAKSNLKIPRGVNQLWTRGGLMYSPPFR